MKRPNFFIVGAPRSGTTAMYVFLKQHPEIYMSRPKEIHYFCTDFHEESDKYHRRKLRFPIRSEEQYLKVFDDASDEAIIGEATTEYLYSKAAAGNIFEFDNNAKILIMLRNPVDLLRSLHLKLLTYGQETITDFGKALEMEALRREGRSLPKGLFYPSSLYYSERIKFSEQIGRYLKYFPQCQVRIVVYDDFKQDNSGVYRDILEFLGVKTTFTPHFRLVNPRQAPKSMFINHIFALLGNLQLARILPFKHRSSLRRKVRHLNTKGGERESLDPYLQTALINKTRPEVERLSKLLGRDLVKLWNYDTD